MLEITIKLRSAIDGHVEDLALASIGNVGPAESGHEYVAIFSETEFGGKIHPQKTAVVHNYPRLDHSVWELLARALREAGYGKNL